MSSDIHDIYERHYGKPEEPKKRGVKPGSNRGRYNLNKKTIRGYQYISTTCKQCKREFTYKRIGKRLKDYCCVACKQKAYRQRKELEEIQVVKY